MTHSPRVAPPTQPPTATRPTIRLVNDWDTAIVRQAPRPATPEQERYLLLMQQTWEYHHGVVSFLERRPG